ncbi:hypothetical protein BDV96DRAFT_683803 [Lophiotrema nucula]|uniref:Uncharacterized protein n=1 Tax=Lophiotrema nucula TaxID=690887 RepID=A0A6A5ZL62_9PLEO|nr:hypothetical protein BDV96DRAFT_683803 [Lophiotrema nucula]
MPGDFAFISVDLKGRAVEADRAKIRSQCMQGKNRRIGSRRDVRSARKLRKAAGFQEQKWTVYQDSQAAQGDYHGSGLENTETKPQPYVDGFAGLPLAAPSPPDIALVRLPIDTSPQSQELLFCYFQLDNELKLHVPFFSVLDFEAFETLQYRWIFEDSIFLQTVLLTTSALVDLHAGLPLQLKTVTRLRKTLKLLNQRLAEDDGYERDVTILIIIILTTVAVIFKDNVAVKAHLNGLGQIVHLRTASPINPKLMLKLDQLGLQYALATGYTPSYLCRTRPLLNHLPNRTVPLPLSMSTSLPPSIFPSLAPILQDLQRLVHSINHHLENGSRLLGEAFETENRSIQVRLLGLGSTATSTPSEAAREVIRLGMLAFLTTMSASPAPPVPNSATSRFPNLAEKLKFALTTTRKDDWEDIPWVIRVWLLISITLTCFTGQERWLREIWADVVKNGAALGWEDVRETLKSVMWIFVVHDRDGEVAWRKLTGR